MSWPYLPDQCPRCRYFVVMDPPGHDDGGYELPGACAHPLIGADLFETHAGLASRFGACTLFVPVPAPRHPQP
jgi:hypothetical protein